MNMSNLSIRDYFASVVISAFKLETHLDYSTEDERLNYPRKNALKFAKDAYIYADALLEIRKNENKIDNN